jgi:hypothetical protein
MIQITLKAKHYYFIVNQLRNFSVEQYFSLMSRIKTALTGNTDLEASFTVDSSTEEVGTIFRICTRLPEGVANVINVEMDDLLTSQIIAGATAEQEAGIGPDENGNLPYEAYWQRTARDITNIKADNASIRNAMIAEGQSFIDRI